MLLDHQGLEGDVGLLVALARQSTWGRVVPVLVPPTGLAVLTSHEKAGVPAFR